MSQIPPILNFTEEDIKKMIACRVQIGAENLDSSMERYVYGRNKNGIHIIDLRKTVEKIQLAARVIVAMENPADVIAVSLNSANSKLPPIAQRAVLKFSQYLSARHIAGRFTPGTFTNQSQKHFVEPRLLVVADPVKDYQPILEASYMNVPVIAMCNTDNHLRNIDIAIPCNTNSKYAVGLVWWLLAREVLRLKNAIPRNEDWDVMVDMFIYRDAEDIEKEESRQPDESQTYTPTIYEANLITGDEADNYDDADYVYENAPEDFDWAQDENSGSGDGETQWGWSENQ
jgi:small subunit ribosomal protein SAe